MAYTDNKKGPIYVDGHERPDIVAYRNRFGDWWFNHYFPHKSYFEGVDMKRVDPELMVGETEIVAVFQKRSYSEQMNISSFVG